MIEQLFTRATELFRARDAAGAERLLRQVLVRAPDHAPSLGLLGLIAGRDGRDAECIALLECAVAGGSLDEAPVSAVWLGAAHARAGRPAEAETAYRRALALNPAYAEARLRLGLLLHEQGRPAEASAELEAAACAAPALAEQPFFLANLAVAKNAEGRFAEAEAFSRRALAVQEDPATLNTLGVALKAQGRLDEAAAALERATALAPDPTQALYNLAAVRKDQGRTDEAVDQLRRTVERAPGLAAARFALVMAHLPPLYEDEPEIERRRADYAEALDALVAHAEAAGFAALAPGVGAAQPFQLAYQGRNDIELQRRYGALACRAMAEAYPLDVDLAGPPAPGERVRVGIVCGQLRDHSVWRLPTRGWVEGLDRSRFALIGYHTGGLRDAETDRAERLFDRFVQGPLAFEAWRARILADGPHVLIYPEVGMDPMAARLAALRLARLQYASWGHPSTTGYPTIDAFLSSAAMEPEDGADHYTERLVRLPGLSTTVGLPPAAGPTPSRASLGLPDAAVVYWSGQSLSKYLPRHDAAFAAIAARVPGCRFVFVEAPGGPGLADRFRARLARAFAAQGLDAETACVWLPRLTSEAYRAAMGAADVALDSLGWSGCNTLVEALALALPVVTLPGDSLRARHGAALLAQLGLTHRVCAAEADYVELAVRLGLDPAVRDAFRREIRESLPRLADRAAVWALEEQMISDLGNPVPQPVP